MLDDALTAPVAALKSLVGPGGWSDDPDRLAPKLTEWRDRWRGETPLLLLPRSVDEVAAIVRHCAEHRLAITPQGGNTGLVGGQIPPRRGADLNRAAEVPPGGRAAGTM